MPRPPQRSRKQEIGAEYAGLLLEMQEMCETLGCDFRTEMKSLVRVWLSANPSPDEGRPVFREKMKEQLDLLYKWGRAAEGGLPDADRKANDIINELLATNDRPKVGVGVVVLKGDNISFPEVLLEKRKHRYGHGEGEWSLPGGWMEHGESFEDTALRELREEVGLGADTARFLTALTNTFPTGLHCVTGYVIVGSWYPLYSAQDGPKIMEPEKMAGLEWFSISRLPDPMFGATRQLLTSTLFTQPNISLEIGELTGRKRK